MAISITFRTESSKMCREIDNFSEMFPQLPRQIIEEVYAVKGSDAFETLWDLCEAKTKSEPSKPTKLEFSETSQEPIGNSNSPENQIPVLQSSEQVQLQSSSFEGIRPGPGFKSRPEVTLLETRTPVHEEVDQLASDLEKSVKWDGDSQESSQFFGNFVPVSEFSYFSDDELLRPWDAYQPSANVPILQSNPASYGLSHQQNKEMTKSEFRANCRPVESKETQTLEFGSLDFDRIGQEEESYPERSSILNKVSQNQGTGFFINPFLTTNPRPTLETSIKHNSSLFLPKSSNLIEPRELVKDKVRMNKNLVEQDSKSEKLKEVSESYLFLQKTSNSQQMNDETDLNDLPLLPPGICENAPSTDSDETEDSEDSLDDLPEASKGQDLSLADSTKALNCVLTKTKKIWSSDCLVIRHCSPHALKFKMKSAIPEELLNTIVQNCQSLPNFHELKSETKKLKLKVFQIARSVRQISVQSRAILEILDSFASNEELIYGYLMLTQTMIRNAKSRTAEGIFSVALVIRHIGSKHPLFIRMIISTLHKLSPLTVPMYWSHDEESAEARIEFQKLMGYTFTTEEDIETVQSENTYLTTHSNLIQLYAALLVAAPKGEVFGMDEGWRYLSRLLNALPPNRTTATALHAFLSFAGYRLYSVYGRQFEKVLRFVRKRFLSEMDNECGDEAAISRLNTYISLQFYLEKPRCLEMPLNEDSQIIRA